MHFRNAIGPRGRNVKRYYFILFPYLPSDPPSLHHRIWSFLGRFVESSTGKLGPDKADSESFPDATGGCEWLRQNIEKTDMKKETLTLEGPRYTYGW